MDPRTIIAGVLLFAGVFFMVVASIGVVRLPDFYSRLHAGGKADTLGQMLVLIGLIVYQGLDLVSVKLLFIILFIFIANPTATHAAAKAAHVKGLKPWRKHD